MRRAILLPALAALAACAGSAIQVVESTPDHVIYRYDPQIVAADRVSSAATTHCNFSPDGSLRAVAVADTVDGPDRVVRFNCTALPELDLNKALGKVEQKIDKALGQ